jgi:hypothetical protein
VMEQVLHILRKDLRHLWPRVLVVLMLITAHAVFEVRGSPVNLPATNRVNAISSLLSMLLPLALCFLIAWAIFEEALPGDRQFWLTRPYRWFQLLVSKVLFVVAFISVPLFLSDCSILGAQGLPVLDVFPRLLLRQLILTALFILPSFAVATVTTGVSQFVVAWAILLLVLLVELILSAAWWGNTSFDSGGSLPFFAVLGLTTCAIIIWQYCRRRTPDARLVLLIVTCAYMPFMWGVSRLTHLNPITSKSPPSMGPSNVQITYDPDPSRTPPTSARAWHPVSAQIPLKVVGVPPRTLLRGSAGLVLDAGGAGSPHSGTIERDGDDYWLSINLSGIRLDDLTQHPVNIRSSCDLEIVTDEVETRVPVTRHSFFVRGVGLCHVFRDTPTTQLTCRAGLEPSFETTIRLDSHKDPGQIVATIRPNQIPWGLSPTSDLGNAVSPYVPVGAEFALIPRHKIARFNQTLDMQNVQISKYILPQ